MCAAPETVPKGRAGSTLAAGMSAGRYGVTPEQLFLVRSRRGGSGHRRGGGGWWHLSHGARLAGSLRAPPGTGGRFAVPLRRGRAWGQLPWGLRGRAAVGSS